MSGDGMIVPVIGIISQTGQAYLYVHMSVHVSLPNSAQKCAVSSSEKQLYRSPLTAAYYDPYLCFIKLTLKSTSGWGLGQRAGSLYFTLVM